MCNLLGVVSTHQLTALPAGITAAAIETDRRYFELGALIDDLDGAQLAWMPGLSALPAAVVVHRVVPAAISRPARWLDAVEARLADLGSPLARIYLDRRDAFLDAALAERGYASRDELVLAGSRTVGGDGPVRVRTIVDERGWEQKRRFHEAALERPDGHHAAAADWVRMERAKCDTGAMEPFLAELDGEVVGAVCALRVEGLLRIKNVATHPAHRRNGVGRAMIAHLAAVARAEGRWGVATFAVSGESGERLYRASGLAVAGAQVEWSRPLLGLRGAP